MPSVNLDYLGSSLTYPNWWRYEDYKNKELLIACTGRSLWEDIRNFDYSRMDVMGVKDAILHFPGPVHHAFSQHADQLIHFVKIREMRRNSTRKQKIEIRMHTSQAKIPEVHTWNLPGHGTSSLGAVYVGLALGYKKIVIAGCPLDDAGHYYDPPWEGTYFLKRVPDRDKGPRYWEHANKTVFKGRVRSLSGRTKALLGAP